MITISIPMMIIKMRTWTHRRFWRDCLPWDNRGCLLGRGIGHPVPRCSQSGHDGDNYFDGDGDHSFDGDADHHGDKGCLLGKEIGHPVLHCSQSGREDGYGDHHGDDGDGLSFCDEDIFVFLFDLKEEEGNEERYQSSSPLSVSWRRHRFQRVPGVIFIKITMRMVLSIKPFSGPHNFSLIIMWTK